MAIGNSDFFDLKGSYGVTLRVHWSETYSVESNQSVVTITGLQVMSEWYYGVTYYLDGTISINDPDSIAVRMSSNGGTNSVTLSALNAFASVGGKFGSVSGITHKDDGTKTTTITVSVKGYTRDGELGSGWSVSGTETINLKTIPRKSTLSTKNGTLGTAQTLTVTQKSTDFSHTIKYSCGSVSDTICTKSKATSISWTPPIDLAWQNKTGTSVAVTLTITTYNGNTSIGSNSIAIACAIPSHIAPSCSMTVLDDTGLDAKYGAMVKGYSKMAVSVTAETSYGAEIAQYRITANDTAYNAASIVTDAVKSSGMLTVSAMVTDQRGRTASASQDVSVLDYSAPAVTLLKVKRCNEDGTENDRGEYVQATFSGTVTALNDKNSATYTLEYKKAADSEYTAVTLTELANNYSISEATHIFEADSGSTYSVRLIITDDLNSDNLSTVVSTGATIMHWKANGKGMGIGKMGELDDTLDMGWNIQMNGNKITDLPTPTEDGDAVRKGSLLDLIYPVNSIYISYSHISPAELFGGTWTRIQNSFLWGVAESGTIGETGGEQTHTLTTNEMPKHRHTSNTNLVNAAGSGTAATAASGSSYGFAYGSAYYGSYVGGGAAHNNMPPYTSVSIWRRIE